MTSRADLLRMLAQRSLELGDFRLSSGGRSDYYIDCRATTLDAEGARLTGRVVLDEIRSRPWRPKAIGGLTLGADPIVTAVSVLSAQLLQRRRAADGGVPSQGEDWLIHGFLVRSKQKQHGTQQRIEGYRTKDAPVVIVDDVCTTGRSIIEAIEAARDFGFNVVGALCLVEREEAGGRPAVEQAAAPAVFASVYMASEIRAERLKLKEAESWV